MFALAERGDFPAVFAASIRASRHPTSRSWCSRCWCGCFPQFGELLLERDPLGGGADLLLRPVCAAVPVLRRMQPHAAASACRAAGCCRCWGCSICAVLLTRVDFSKSVVLLLTIGVACSTGRWSGGPRSRLAADAAVAPIALELELTRHDAIHSRHGSRDLPGTVDRVRAPHVAAQARDTIGHLTST